MTNRRVLIVAAVPEELAGFRSEARHKADGGQGVECLLTGMGARAGSVLRRHLAQGNYRLVVSAGFAGGLRPGFRVGDLVFASEVIEGSSGLRRRPGASVGANGWASVGPFLTVEKTVPEPADKAQMGGRSGAIAVDLETALVAKAAEEMRVPWVGIRVILDPMEVRLPAASLRQAVGLLLRPGRWRELSRFMGSVRTASESLAAGLDRFAQMFMYEEMSLTKRSTICYT